jgi:hypothetical protein
MNIRAAKFVQNLRGLSAVEKSIAYSIAVHADYKNCQANMSMQTLAEESGLKHRQAASQIVSRLLEYGIIHTIGSRSGGRKPSTYQFTFAVNRDCGITIKDEESNRNWEQTVEDYQPQPNRNSRIVQPQSEPSPTAIKNAPTVRRSGHEGFKETEGREGEKETATAARSLNPSGVDELLVLKVAKETKPNAVFSQKSLGDIRAVLRSKQPTQAEVIPVVQDAIHRMDDFQLKNAGSYLPAELDGGIEAQRALARTERRKQQEDARIRANVEAQIKAESERIAAEWEKKRTRQMEMTAENLL